MYHQEFWNELAKPLTNLINLSVERSFFWVIIRNQNHFRDTNAKIGLCLESTTLSILSSLAKRYNQQLYEYFKHVLSLSGRDMGLIMY